MMGGRGKIVVGRRRGWGGSDRNADAMLYVSEGR